MPVAILRLIFQVLGPALIREILIPYLRAEAKKTTTDMDDKTVAIVEQSLVSMPCKSLKAPKS